MNPEEKSQWKFPEEKKKGENMKEILAEILGEILIIITEAHSGRIWRKSLK